MSKTEQIQELRREVENLKGQVAVLLQIVRPTYYPPYRPSATGWRDGLTTYGSGTGRGTATSDTSG